MTTPDAPPDLKTACLCPLCTSNPARTYTDEFKQECLARWFVKASGLRRAEYLTALYKNKNGEKQIVALRNTAQRLGLPLTDFP
jgi:hypothetical protein